MNKQTTNQLSEQLRRRLLYRFIFSCLLYAGIGGFLFLLIYWYYHTRIWYGYETFYIVISTLERFHELFMILYLLIGALIFGYRYLSKSCAYLDELLTASDSLWKNQEEPVVMSDDLREAALHMNEVRLDIIESRKAANEAEQRKNDLEIGRAHV